MADDSMTHPVPLSEVVDAMAMQSDEITAYLHRPTGRIVVISSDALQAAEEDDEELVEDEELADARAVLARVAEYLALPDRFEIDEYRMMARFSAGLDDAGARDTLLAAIRGGGAFRRFKDAIHVLGVASEWYAYRDRAYLDVARAWCAINGIAHDSARADA